MSLSTERGLAMMAAEDGELQEAEEALTALIDRLGPEPAAGLADGDAVYALCRCLVDRASVRMWAVRPAASLQDLARAEMLAGGLKPLNRHSVLVGLLDTRARLLSKEASPEFDLPAAQAAATQLRAAASEAGMPWLANAVEMRLATQMRDWPQVLSLGGALIERLQDSGHIGGVNRCRIAVAEALLELGRREQAIEPAQAAHQFFVREGPPDLAASAALALARALGRPTDWALAEQALAGTERLTRAQRSLFDQQRYLVERLRVYEDALRLALAHLATAPNAAARRVAIVRAWEVAERAKSFSLRQAMTQGGWLQAMDPDSAAQLQTLESRLQAVEAQAETSAAAAQLRAELSAQRQQVLQAAMQRSPAVNQAQAVPALDVPTVLAALAAGVGVLSWYWLEQSQGWQLHVFHAGADHEPRHAQTTWSHAEVEALTRARSDIVHQRPFRVQPLLPAALGDRVFPPAALDALAGCHTLLLTPHRHLRQLPLHAAQVSTPAAGQGASAWLIERFAVQVLPTLALPFPDRDGRAGAKQVLLMGCRQDGFRSNALPDVPIELDSVARAWSAAGHCVSAHAMAAEDLLDQHVALARWSEFDFIHLACHGRFVAASPLDATLYLGSQALRASEFFGLRLRADVVCLSACDVGQHSATLDGLALVSDEWLGLALPLFQAGARSLLASLWLADSATACAFMQAFHGALAQGLDAAHAHRQACLSQLRRPFGLWANWQLAGFPR